MSDYPYIWSWGKRPTAQWNVPGDYKGKRCRVLVRSSRMNSAALEFEDGYKVVTSRGGIRKAGDG